VTRPRVLDLFSGMNGWTEAFRGEAEVFSVDIDPAFEADAYLDIGDTRAVLGALPWRPDVVLASPPCNSFSTMTMGRMWTPAGEPKHPTAVQGRRLVLATLRLIAILRPTFWVIENPRARLRTIGFLDGIERRTVTYCQLGEQRMKPTDLWGVFPPGLELPAPCKNGDPCHIPAPRGSTTGTQGTGTAEAGRIPTQLSRLVFDAAVRALA
jgi:hypothetical protein